MNKQAFKRYLQTMGWNENVTVRGVGSSAGGMGCCGPGARAASCLEWCAACLTLSTAVTPLPPHTAAPPPPIPPQAVDYGDLSYLLCPAYTAALQAELLAAQPFNISYRRDAPKPEVGAVGTRWGWGWRWQLTGWHAAGWLSLRCGVHAATCAPAAPLHTQPGKTYLVAYTIEAYPRVALRLKLWPYPRGHHQHVAAIPFGCGGSRAAGQQHCAGVLQAGSAATRPFVLSGPTGASCPCVIPRPQGLPLPSRRPALLPAAAFGAAAAAHAGHAGGTGGAVPVVP